MNSIKKWALLFTTLTIVSGFMSCKKDDDQNIGNNPAASNPANAIVVHPSDGSYKTAHMNVHMVDAPSAYAFQQVNVSIHSMAGLITTPDGQQTWVNLGANASVYNAASLVNGQSALISDATVYAGHLSQIQVVFADNNSVVIGGQTQQLSFSGSNSVMLNVNYDIEENEDFDLMLDFDIAGSVIAQGSNGQGSQTFVLSPSIHIFSSEETSEMSGQLLLGGGALIVASNGSQSYSTYANADGYFMLQGMNEGSYTLTAYFTNGLSLTLGSNIQLGVNLNLNLGLLLQGDH